MSNARVCHVSTGSRVINQPRATLLPSIPAAVDLPSAIAAINALKLLIQLISGQQSPTGPSGVNGFFPPFGGVVISSPGSDGKKGDENKEKNGRFIEDRSKRVQKKKRVFQNNDKKSENWVDIMQINRVVWVDRVTGETIVWSR